MVEGRTLEWWLLSASLGTFQLRALAGAERPVKVAFSGTLFLDLPQQLHNVRIQVASEEEAAARRCGLTSKLAATLRRAHLVSFEADEGCYSLWAGAASVRLLQHRDLEFMRSLDSALRCQWPLGAPLTKL